MANEVNTLKGHKALYRLCFFTLGFLGIYISVFQRILDEIAINFSGDKIFMGLLVAAHFAGIFAGPLIAGELSDKFGRRVVIISSLISFMGGFILILTSFNTWVLAMGIFLAGAGFGVLEGTVTTLLTDVNPENSNQIIGVSQIFFSVGAVVGPFIAMPFIDSGWKAFYGACAVFILLLGYLFRRQQNINYKADIESKGIISFELIRKKTFVLLLASITMYVGIEEGVAFWITSYIKENYTSEFYPSIILSAFWGGMIVGRYIISRFSDKLNELVIAGSSFSIIFIVASLFTRGLWPNLVSFIGIGFCLSGIWPMIMALVKDYFPRYVGSAFGIMMAGCAVGGALVPFAMGYIGHTVNMKWALAFCVVPALIIILCHTLVIRFRQRTDW